MPPITHGTTRFLSHLVVLLFPTDEPLLHSPCCAQLSYNVIGSNGFARLSASLVKLTRLECLNLSFNDAGFKGGAHSIVHRDFGTDVHVHAPTPSVTTARLSQEC